MPIKRRRQAEEEPAPRGRTAKRGREPVPVKRYPSSMLGWYTRDGNAISGFVKFDREMLQEALDAHEDGEPGVIDERDEEKVVFSFYLSLEGTNSIDALGSLKINFVVEEEPPKRQRARRPR